MIDKLISAVVTFFLLFIPTVSNPIIPTDKQTTIIFTGDIMLGRSVMGEALDKNDLYYPFRKTAEFLSSADITFVNLENAIIKNCLRQGKGSFTFCITPEIAKGFNFAGIDIVSLANNHSSNYGKEGFEETKQYLTDNKIDYVGDGNLIIKEINNIKFGFLGFDYTVSQTNLARDLDQITRSHLTVDNLIVGVHWGEEYKAVASSMQKVVGKKMVDAGADVIIGHHPHWVQNYEEYQGKPIYYSLGNFIFDQMWSEETKKGLVVKLTFKDTNLIKKEEYKTYIKTIGQPELWP